MKLRTIGTRMFGPVRRRKSGQSLVEMAIIAPLLLLMFIGVLEVGWALRGYMIILNASREAARFAARGRYIDYTGSSSEIAAGYQTVISHTLDTLGYGTQAPLGQSIAQGQADVAMKLVSGATGDKSGYGTIIISHFLIDTQKPCTPAPLPGGVNPGDDCNGNSITATVEGPEIDCAGFKNTPPISGYTADDRIWAPPAVTQTFTFPSPANFTSALNAAAMTTRFKADNNYFNCVLHTKDPNVPYSANSVIVVEIYFNQPQLLGVPLVSNALTDPVHLYAYTEMRITGDARSSGK